jgi:long-chain acyl-CoA synthetase
MQKPWLSFYERGVPHTLAYSDLPLDTLLKRAARSYPSHTASNFILSYLLNGNGAIGGKLTYARLNELVDRFATALYQLGVRKGSRVALMLPNSPHFLIAFFATLRLGAVVVTINPAYTAREVHYQLDDSGAETIVLLNLFWPRLREIQSSTALKRVVVAHIFDTLPFPHNLLVYARQRRQRNWVKVKPEHDIFFFNRLLTKYGPTPPRVEVRPDDIALFQYTGGTTGTPKAAMLTHRNLMANTTQCVAWVTDGRPGHEKSMAAVPFFHVYGLSVCLLYSVAIASEMIIVPDPRQIEQVMRIIQRERCTLFPGVPAMYLAIVNHPRVRSYDLRSVRACISGSAPLPVEVQRRFDEVTGGRLVEGFGLSEASPVTHCNPLYGERRAGSIGIPFPDVDARLVDTESGAVLPLGAEQSGELQVRGPQVMSGYWNRPDDTRATLDAEGWLSTGDICSTDEDGYFYLIDRKKDMMIVGGYKVLPREVEEVLYMHPTVRQAAVVGVPDSERGDDIVTAFIVSHSDEQRPSVEELRDFCRIHLAAYKIPRRIEYRNELPTTLVGKVLRRVLVEEAQATEATAEQS